MSQANSFRLLREMQESEANKKQAAEEKIRIEIHFINGSKYPMWCHPDMTGEQVCAELWRRHNEDATLIFLGKTIAPDATLSGRGIQNGHIIHGLRKVRGD